MKLVGDRTSSTYPALLYISYDGGSKKISSQSYSSSHPSKGEIFSESVNWYDLIKRTVRLNYERKGTLRDWLFKLCLAVKSWGHKLQTNRPGTAFFLRFFAADSCPGVATTARGGSSVLPWGIQGFMGGINTSQAWKNMVRVVQTGHWKATAYLVKLVEEVTPQVRHW